MLYVSRLSGRFFAGALAAFLLVTGVVAWDTARYMHYMEGNGYSFQNDRGLYEKHSWVPLHDYQRNRILSITDALTGAYNRRYLMEQLPREVERCRRYAYPLSVLMCDLDHFKQINDQRGHAAGDDVLQQFAARAQKSIRPYSDWIARYGGEEFLIVLPETAHADGLIVAEKIRNIVAGAPFTTRAGDAALTASFGVASTGPQGPDLSLKVETLIRAADECLYKSKAEGRNRTSGQEIAVSLALMAHG